MRAQLLVQNIIIYLVNDVINIILLRWLNSVDTICTILIMKGALLLLVVYLFHGEAVEVVTNDEEGGENNRPIFGVVNNRPIIGILSQEQSFYLHTKYPAENYTSYIAASYVKAVEASGARVVPIMIGKERVYYYDIMRKINGVLLPGGATYFNQSDGYADAGQHIFEIAKAMNDVGDYFPIFGICLGFELLIILDSGRREPENRISCYCFGNRNLKFTSDFRTSKMYKNIPTDIIELLIHEDVTVNAHQFCIVDENLLSHNLTQRWRVTSHSNDAFGIFFIASIENTMYPFYGVQFHPEKNAFEWKRQKKYPSTANGIKVNRYFMDFFVNECRKSNHSFASVTEENQSLIYNYQPYFTGAHGSAYQQCYFFEPRGTANDIMKKDNSIEQFSN